MPGYIHVTIQEMRELIEFVKYSVPVKGALNSVHIAKIQQC